MENEVEHPVSIASTDRELYGIYHESLPCRGAVLICHGLGGTRVDVHRICVRLARSLVERQFSCLRIDLTGSGISQGRFYECTLPQQHCDMQHALDWLRHERRATRLYLLGFSDGAIVVHNLGAQSSHVSGMVFWSPTFFPEGEAAAEPEARFARRLHRVDNRAVWPVLGHWLYKDYFEDKERERAGIDLEEMDKRCLLVYGEHDEYLRMRVGEIRNPLIRVEQIPEANHLFFSPTWTRRVIDLTIDWLADDA